VSVDGDTASEAGWRLGPESAKCLPDTSTDSLGLELEVVDEKLRLWAGGELLLKSAELLERMQGMMEQVQRRADEAERRADDAERRLAELEARLGQRQPH
jgi:hypothetical protein